MDSMEKIHGFHGKKIHGHTGKVPWTFPMDLLDIGMINLDPRGMADRICEGDYQTLLHTKY